MPVPKRKRSKSRRDRRFANKGLEEIAITKCAQCSEAIAPHQACKFCGFYKGSKVLKTKLDRGLKRKEQGDKLKAAHKDTAETTAE